MLAEIFMVRSEAAARLQQETALLSSSTFTPFTPNNQFLFKDRAAFPDDPRWETGNEEVSYGRSRPISAIAIFSTLCATPKCPQHASKIFGPKLWFRGGISREGSYMANGDFGGTLDVSTFLSSFLAFFTTFFSFFACFRSPFVILDI
jgi:hypothetical protein